MAQTIPMNPEKHFGFVQCTNCRFQPCSQLRTGLVTQGKFFFVLRRHYGHDDCVFSIDDFSHVRHYLSQISFYQLNKRYLDVVRSLSAIELNSHDPELFLNSWDDINGRIEFLHHLFINRIIAAIGIPPEFEKNPKIIAWLNAFHGQAISLGEVQQEFDTTSPAASDDMVDSEQEEEIAVTNPQWEHVNEARKEESPDETIEEDTIALSVSISGAPEGAAVTFDIFDTATSPPARVGTVRGKNENGSSTAEWKVEDPRNDSDTRECSLEFEASVRSKASERKAIPLLDAFSIQLDIDPDEAASADDTFTLFSTDSGQSFKQTKTIKDDKVSGDDYVDLTYIGLKRDLSYTLEVDPGKEGDPYMIFENKPFGKWME